MQITRIFSYHEWKESVLVTLEQDNAIIECPKCRGDGVIEEECECCGHDSERDCPACDGAGKLLFSELDKEYRSLMVTESRYYEVLIKDLTALAEWKQLNRIQLLIEHGFTVYSHILNKKEIIKRIH